MLKQESSRKSRLIEDVISVQDIILEYIINSGWKDYNKFARKLTNKIVEEQPSTSEVLAKLVRNFAHPFFSFNKITKEQFLSRFPLSELLQQSAVRRPVLFLTKQHPKPKRGGISKKLRFLVLQRDNFRCCICGRTAKETKLEVDHKIPVSKGGTDSLDNLWTLCIDCNRGKSDLQIKV
jgi:CRISPR/Cas system Type II protein with McrA/HNH and RuvC-like nuclease domain